MVDFWMNRRLLDIWKSLGSMLGSETGDVILIEHDLIEEVV